MLVRRSFATSASLPIRGRGGGDTYIQLLVCFLSFYFFWPPISGILTYLGNRG